MDISARNKIIGLEPIRVTSTHTRVVRDYCILYSAWPEMGNGGRCSLNNDNCAGVRLKTQTFVQWRRLISVTRGRWKEKTDLESCQEAPPVTLPRGASVVSWESVFLRAELWEKTWCVRTSYKLPQLAGIYGPNLLIDPLFSHISHFVEKQTENINIFSASPHLYLLCVQFYLFVLDWPRNNG